MEVLPSYPSLDLQCLGRWKNLPCHHESRKTVLEHNNYNTQWRRPVSTAVDEPFPNLEAWESSQHFCPS